MNQRLIEWSECVECDSPPANIYSHISPQACLWANVCVCTAALFPGLCRFRLHEGRGQLGIFPHVHEVNGRKVVETNVVALGSELQEAGNLPLAGGDCHTHQTLNVCCERVKLCVCVCVVCPSVCALCAQCASVSV